MRAKYALAEVHEALGDEDASEALLSEIIRDHPESVFADRARISLSMAVQEEAPDSLELALAQYSRAYEVWNDGQLQQALDDMVRTAADHPTSLVAAKALLAGAAIFTEMAQGDSLDVFGIMPLGDSVLTAEEIELARSAIEQPDVAPDSAGADSMVAEDISSLDTSGSPDSVDEPRDEDELTKAVEEEVGRAARPDAELSSTRPPTSGDSPSVALDDDPTIGRRARQAVPDELEDAELPRNRLEDDLPSTPDTELIAPPEEALVDELALEAGAVSPDTLEEVGQQPDADSLGAVPQIADADSSAIQQPQPADPAPPEPTIPDWIEPEYFVNTVVPQPMTLYGLYTSLEANFRDSEFGERASSLKRGLIAHRDEYYRQEDQEDQNQPADSAATDSALRVTIPDTTLVTLDR
jgi:hypothetical protein